jgi:hypothetical protein
MADGLQENLLEGVAPVRQAPHLEIDLDLDDLLPERAP